MTLLDRILTFVADHPLPASVAMVLLSLLDIWLTRIFSASVKYLSYVRPASALPDDSHEDVRGTVVLKNMEASKIDKPLRLEIHPTKTAKIDVERVSAAAGPWLKQISKKKDGLLIELTKFPAEGAIAFSFSLSDEDELSVKWTDDTKGVRQLSKLRPKFNGPLYFWKRGVLGLGWFTVLFAALISSRGEITYVDGAIYVGGLALVALAWYVALPMSGKDTACGYPMKHVTVETGEADEASEDEEPAPSSDEDDDRD